MPPSFKIYVNTVLHVRPTIARISKATVELVIDIKKPEVKADSISDTPRMIPLINMFPPTLVMPNIVTQYALCTVPAIVNSRKINIQLGFGFIFKLLRDVNSLISVPPS